jgi:hypothetical protein
VDSQQGSPAAGGSEIFTSFDQQGFPVVVTQAPGAATAVKHYDDQGFLITTGAALASRASPTALAENAVSSPLAAAESTAASSPVVTKIVSQKSQASSRFQGFGLVLGAASCILAKIYFM